MNGRIYRSFERQVQRTGTMETSVMLNATAEQVRELADAHDDAAESYGKKSRGYHVFRNSARTLRKIASIIEMHALYHIGDEPIKLNTQMKRTFLGKKPR